MTYNPSTDPALRDMSRGLAPCAHCGRAVAQIKWLAPWRDHDPHKFYIECTHCLMRTALYSLATSAVRTWQTRVVSALDAVALEPIPLDSGKTSATVKPPKE